MSIGVVHIMEALSPTISAEYSAFASPNSLVVSSGSGAATTPYCTCTVTGGVGPFTYEWTAEDSDIKISDEDSDTTRFTLSGYSGSVFSQATVTVKDSGNSDAEVSDKVLLNFNFGTLL